MLVVLLPTFCCLTQAKLRREAVTARKEASQARLELAKASRSSEHRAQETSSLKAALKGRDVLLEELQGRIRQLEDELARYVFDTLCPLCVCTTHDEACARSL